MRKNMRIWRNVWSIYAAYIQHMPHISLHISGIYNIEWWRITIVTKININKFILQSFEILNLNFFNI